MKTMEGPFDNEIAISIDPEECVFNESNGCVQTPEDEDDDIEILTPSTPGHRSEPKLSLSVYESVRSLSASGETTHTEPQSREGTQDTTDLSQTDNSTHVDAVVKVKQAHEGPSTSTPVRVDEEVKDERELGVSPVVRGGDNASSSVLNARQPHRQSDVVSVDPLKLNVPLVGYEVMEQRDRFTVFKLHVHNGDRDNWFVFRRYTDFTQLQLKLKQLFPMFRLSLPPKRWFRDNYEKQFLDDRMHGLQVFVDSILRHRNLCNSLPVQEFFCFNDPPGPHDSVEESRAYCEELEDAVYNLKKVIREKDSEIGLMKDELNLYKSQVEMLSKALRDYNTNGASAVPNNIPSPANSLAECDLTAPEVDQSYSTTQEDDQTQSKTLADPQQVTEDTNSPLNKVKTKTAAPAVVSTSTEANIQERRNSMRRDQRKPGLPRLYSSFDR